MKIEKNNSGGVIVIGLVVVVILGLIASLFFFAPKNIKDRLVKKGGAEVSENILKEKVKSTCQGNEECFSEAAITKGNEEFCSYAEDEEIKKNCLDNFYSAMSGRQDNIENCDKVSNEEKKDSCKDSFLENKSTTLLVNASTIEELDTMKDLCEQMSEQEGKKQHCLNSYNYQRAERTIMRDKDLEKSTEFCDQIKDDEILLDTCHKNLKIRI